MLVERSQISLVLGDEVERLRLEPAEAVVDPGHLGRRRALVVGEYAPVRLNDVGGVPPAVISEDGHQAEATACDPRFDGSAVVSAAERVRERRPSAEAVQSLGG